MSSQRPSARPRSMPPPPRELLRFFTCGSVDDGKSTLIGRLLHDSQLIFEDQLATLAKDSRKHGTTGEEIDLALLVDGLEAEREQGITIDVAYRFFSTPRRSFIVADSPGHEQYTRNMATAASNSSLAIILIDARKGVLTQTKRHSYICSLLGIRDIVIAVNKMDLVDFSQQTFDRIVGELVSFAADFGFRSIVPVPMSARYGDNVTSASGNMSWYRGRTLLEHLETIEVARELDDKPFRFHVQWVNRPNLDFRGYSGTIASGRIAAGDAVVAVTSGKGSRISRIVTADGDVPTAKAGDAVTLTLESEIDIARGDLLTRPTERPEVADQFAAHLLWLDDEAMLPGRAYMIRLGNRWAQATVTSIKHRVDVNTLERHAARRIELNEIAFCNLSSSVVLPIEAYTENRATGAFILVDRFTNRTSGAGMIAFALRRSANIHHESFLIDKKARAELLGGQKPLVLWFTGLSGSGKSAVSKIVEERLHAAGKHTYTLDGDNARHGLCRDLGFTDEDRVENIRRIGEVAKLFVDAGLIVLCSFISPFRAERRMVRELVADGEFIEIFVDTPIEECIERDPKGLYAKAMAGKIKNFTGIDSPYEPPEAPEIHLRTTGKTPEQLADMVLEALGVFLTSS
jgi:bifunctional enzyme CysN/CysC